MKSTAVYPFEFKIRTQLHKLASQLFNIEVLPNNHFSSDAGFTLEFDLEGRLVRVDHCVISFTRIGLPIFTVPTLYYDNFQYPEYTIAGWHLIQQKSMERILDTTFTESDFKSEEGVVLAELPLSYQVIF